VYRHTDGERVEGTWRHVFVRDGDSYRLADLIVYADGLLDCLGPITLDELRDKVTSGVITTSPVHGGRGTGAELGEWRFGYPVSRVSPADLLAEVADRIEQLNGRPDSQQRCLDAIRAYLGNRTEANRLAIRAAYLAIPEHLRANLLGDTEQRDWPVQVLIADDGYPVRDWAGEEIPIADRSVAIKQLEQIETARLAAQRDRPDYRYDDRRAATIVLQRNPEPVDWYPGSGFSALANDYLATVTAYGRDYPSVTHAYLALSAAHAATHDRITAAPTAAAARVAATGVVVRADWADLRLAVMAELLRAKFTAHDSLRRLLLSTGDARITYDDFDSAYWTVAGANWFGRLLEVIRAELHAATFDPWYRRSASVVWYDQPLPGL
jgi:predicted NAD-dependent protein-ADP-ribosyltransferase YbiA (DUF1768 family)